MTTTLSPVSLSGLTCENRKAPLGIDILVPRLSWKIESERRGVTQLNYQIRVALKRSDLIQDKHLVWDSGVVISDQSIDIEYTGPSLQSRQRYYWRVRVWDEKENVSDWSDITFWEMGLLNHDDWEASWIEPVQSPGQKEPPFVPDGEHNSPETDVSRLNPCQFLRNSFELKKNITKARVYATAHGIYSLEINGKKAGTDELAPGNTSYHRYLAYQTYDITDWVTPGKNVIGAILADGWYIGRIGFMGESCDYGDQLGIITQIEVEYADGTHQRVCTDDSFVSSSGPYLYSDLFIGEKYDARLEFPHWSENGFDDTGWTRVNVASHRRENLVAQYTASVKAVQEIVPVAVIITPQQDTIIDLGQNIAGRIRMKVAGPSGTEVVLEHSEVLDEEGNFMLNIAGRNRDQKDTYILKGSGEETYEPRFSFHGFRYVKVTGYPGDVTIEKFTGVVLSTEMEITGFFDCSNPKINQLQSNIVWSQKTNMISIPTDCPQRERAGWTGDIQVFAPTAAFNLEVNAFLTQWVQNLKVDQLADGQVPSTIPYTKAYQQFFNRAFGKDSSAGWGDAVIIVPWVLYQKYGDIRILRETYDNMVSWISYVTREAESNLPPNIEAGALSDEEIQRQKYLWNSGFHFSDWLVPSLSLDIDTGEVDMVKSAIATMELVPTCFFAYAAELMSNIAEVLNLQEDRDYYEELSQHIRQAFTDEFLLEDGRLKCHLQGIYVLALKLNMVPRIKRDDVFSQLVGLIEENDFRLDTGFLSMPFLMDTLCDFERSDIAYTLLYQTKCPSWLYEIEKKATSIWEVWQAIQPEGKVSKVSFNHYAFGCVGDWLYRYVAGLDAASPGYKKLNIRPRPDKSLTHVKASFQSRYGKVISYWEKSPDKTIVKLTIPPNTTASVWLPGAELNAVSENGITLEAHPDVKSAEADGEDVKLVLFSGAYCFEYPTIKFA